MVDEQDDGGSAAGEEAGVTVAFAAPAAAAPRDLTRLSWRTLEWWGAGIALFCYSGALFPILLAPDGLDDAARAKLRLLALPAYLVTCGLLYRCARQVLVVVRRNLPFTLLLFLPFISILWSVSGSITLRRAIGLLLSVALAYLLAIRFSPRQLAALVAAVLVPLMVLSLLLAVAVPHLGRMPVDAEASGVRGVFVHKNVLGWYSGVCVLALVGLLADGTYLSRRLVVALLGVAGLCLVASTSMTGLLATAAALALIPFYGGLRRHHGIGRTMLVLFFLQALVLLGVALAEFLVPALEWLGKDATLTGRVPLWRLVDAEIGRHLLLGSGYQAFWSDANPEAWRIWFRAGWKAPHAHSGYRDVLLNFGLIGMLVLGVTVVRVLRQGAALYCRQPEDGWLWLNLFVGWTLVLNLAESVLLVQNDFLFVLFATAILSMGLRAPETLRPQPPAWWEGPLPASGKDEPTSPQRTSRRRRSSGLD